MKVDRYADSVGVLGGVFAALCCAGNTYIILALSAIGLSALRADAVLWPLMLVSLAVGEWGFWRGWRAHGRRAPLALGTIGTVSVAAGVILVHGFPALQMIYGGSLLMVVALVLNIRSRRLVQLTR